MCSRNCSPVSGFDVWEQAQVPDDVLEAALRGIL